MRERNLCPLAATSYTGEDQPDAPPSGRPPPWEDRTWTPMRRRNTTSIDRPARRSLRSVNQLESNS